MLRVPSIALSEFLNRAGPAGTRTFMAATPALTSADRHMLKIEVEFNGSGHLIRLIGRIRREHLDALAVKIAEGPAAPSLDLREVTLVDINVVRFLLLSEQEGVTLRHCPPFIREWIERETIAGISGATKAWSAPSH